MKRVSLLFILFFFLSGFMTTAFAEDKADIELYGFRGNGEEEYVVTLGHPVFSRERAPLGSLIGVYMANSVHWTNLGDGSWAMIEYRMPETKEERAYMTASKVEMLMTRKMVREDELPSAIKELPPAARRTIMAFLQFYSGAFRIYLHNDSEESARFLANALNTAR